MLALIPQLKELYRHSASADITVIENFTYVETKTMLSFLLRVVVQLSLVLVNTERNITMNNTLFQTFGYDKVDNFAMENLT